MSHPSYSGLCLGGPKAGSYLSSPTPEVEVFKRSAALLSANPVKLTPGNTASDKSKYFFVPHRGRVGFWLHDSETLGSHPFDDIQRVFVEAYIKLHGFGPAQSKGGAA
jgi:hypothetical protein